MAEVENSLFKMISLGRRSMCSDACNNSNEMIQKWKQ